MRWLDKLIRRTRRRERKLQLLIGDDGEKVLAVTVLIRLGKSEIETLFDVCQ